MMKPQQVPLNKTLNKGGKGRTKRDDPSMSHKNIIQNGLEKGK